MLALFKNNLAIAVLIAMIVFVVFIPSLSNDFVRWDDDTYLLNNINFGGLDAGNPEWIFTDSYRYTMFYMPVTWLSLFADHMIWGWQPFGYHLTNSLIHALSAAVLYFLAYSLLSSAFVGRSNERSLKIGAAFAALAWAIHPLRVESVAWITERKDVLCGLFYILTILTYLQYVKIKKLSWLTISVFLALLAILSKPIAVSIPLTLLIIDRYPLRRSGNNIIEKLPYILLALASSAATIYAQYHFNTEDSSTVMSVVGIGDRLLIMSYGLRFYLEKMILPFGLSPLYELWDKLYILRENALFNYTFLGAFLIAVWHIRKRFRPVFFAFLFFILALLPVSGLMQAGPQIAADRFTYIPTIGLTILAGGSLIYAGRKLIYAVAIILLIFFTALTVKQEKIWRNSLSLWEHAVRVSPYSGLARLKLGHEYMLAGFEEKAAEQFTLANILNRKYREYFKIR